MDGLLTLCMLARDSENRLQKYFSKYYHLFEHVMVVDTGSIDQTIPYLKSLNINIIQDTWQDNFSKSRNVYLDAVKTKWVLVLDSDELISEDQLNQLRNLLLESPDSVYGYLVRVFNYHSHKNILDFTAREQCPEFNSDEAGVSITKRLICFRNHPHVRYRGRVHESVNKSITELSKRIAETNVFIHNYGYKDPLISSEHRESWYFSLLKKDAEEFPMEPKFQFEVGIKYFENKGFEEAIRHLSTAIKFKPNYFEAHFYRGKAYRESHQMHAAMEDLMIALQDKNLKGEVHFELGQLFEQGNFYEKALSAYEVALDVLPNNAPVYWHILRVCEKLGMEDKQLQIFEAISRSEGRSRNWFFYRAIYFAKRKMWHKALADIEHAKKIDSRHLPSLYYRALIQSHLRDITGALSQVRDLLKIDPSHIEGRQLLEFLNQLQSLEKIKVTATS